MYLKFYGFNEKPFQIVPNLKYTYRSEKLITALSYLRYGLYEAMGFILLTGDVGSGKTTLINVLRSKLKVNINAAVIFWTNVSHTDLFRMILKKFKLRPEGDKAANLEKLHAHLIKLYRADKRALLIIDEAQNLCHEAFEDIRMLSNPQTNENMLLQIMLVGQKELFTKLQHTSMHKFKQRIAVKYHLTGLSRDDTSKYIEFRMMRAGGKPDLFTKGALDLIFEISKGIPRAINLACQAALIYGFINNAKHITQDIIMQNLDDHLIIGFDKNQEQSVTSKKEENPAQSDNHEKNQMNQRFDIIQTNLNIFQDSVRENLYEIERRLESTQNNTMEHLHSLLKDEQQKYFKLVEDHAQLKLKYRALLELSKNKMIAGSTMIQGKWS